MPHPRRRRNTGRTRRLVLGLTCGVLLAACSEAGAPVGPPEPPAPPEEPEPPSGGRPVYRVPPPAGKLPWPHHDPAWDSTTYAAKLDSLWVVNNFAQYTGTADRSILYLHDAWDLVLPNGTPIYSVTDGIVRAVQIGDPFYSSVFVEDLHRPGHSWGYTHIFHFTVKPGDTVFQGQKLGVVNFRGLEHVHLGRYVWDHGGTGGGQYGSWTVTPDHYFVYRDDEPPTFDGRFRFVRNLTDDPFTARTAAGHIIVSGDVDIVVGLRDGGEWTRSKGPIGSIPSLGDSHSVARIEYDIAGPSGSVVQAVAFDKLRLRISRNSAADRAAQLLTMFQHYESATPRPTAGFGEPRFGYYIITNSSGIAHQGPYSMTVEDAGRSWQTAARLADGAPRFPDGDYVITVRAWDSAGNMAARADTVHVRN
jgi:hypothetical protein